MADLPGAPLDSQTASAHPTGSIEDESIESRHYVFLCFLTVLNVMNIVDRQLLRAWRTMWCRISASPTRSSDC